MRFNYLRVNTVHTEINTTEITVIIYNLPLGTHHFTEGKMSNINWKVHSIFMYNTNVQFTIMITHMYISFQNSQYIHDLKM